MAHNRDKLVIVDQNEDFIVYGHSCWIEPNEPGVHSILSIETGAARLQINGTAANLDALSRFFARRAATLRAMEEAEATPATTTTKTTTEK